MGMGMDFLPQQVKNHIQHGKVRTTALFWC